jgi:hypothetical protein
MDGGNIRRHQDWTASKNIARFAKTMTSQNRWIFDFHMASDSLEVRPKLNLLQVMNDIKQSLELDRANGYSELDQSGTDCHAKLDAV